MDADLYLESLTLARQIWPSESVADRKWLDSNGAKCPECGGAGIVLFDAPDGRYFKKRVLCLCSLARLHQQRQEAARVFSAAISDYERGLTLEDLRPWGRQDDWATMEKAIEGARRFIENPGWLLLAGGRGCGKTHLALAIANELERRGVTSIYAYATDLAQRLFDATRNSGPEPLLDALAETPLLILDDLGTEYQTAFILPFFDHIIDSRYRRRGAAPTIVTTNLQLGELYERYYRIASRAIDRRLVQTHEITLGDYRLQCAGRSLHLVEAAA